MRTLMEIITTAQNLPVTLADVQEVNRLLAQRIAKGTRRVYISDFQLFTAWCLPRNIDPKNATPEAIAVFLANQFEAGRHPSTLNRRLAAIRFAYKALNKPSPTEHELVRATLKGIRRDKKSKTYAT